MINKAIKRNHVQLNIFIYIFLSYLITWSYFLPKILFERNIISFKLPEYFEIVAAFGPALAAIIVTIINGGIEGLYSLLRRVYLWKVDLKWYLIALFLQPIIWTSAICINILLGNQSAANNIYFDNLVKLSYGMALLIFAFLTQFITLLGEEIGWRGYMLPKILSVKNWIYSSLILGVVWAIWHLPLFYLTDYSQSNIPIGLYFIDLMASTFLFTWIYFYTKGSVLIAGLFHASINTSTTLLPILPFVISSTLPYIFGIVLKLIIVICLIAKHKTSIRVKYTGDEGKGLKKIGLFINTIFNFFEKIVFNMYKDN